jgi:pimeloyl-ACP methyl ester carboxylesterase
MPTAKIRGAELSYEALGEKGPWMALVPGGRRGMDGVRVLAEKMAKHGYRVLIHDRRNTGKSDVSIEGKDSEYEVWADDMHELLKSLGGLPAVIGGSSSGCRTSLLFYLRHPEATSALLLWRVTGGVFAADRLANQYYGQFIEAAQKGGMKAVCETEHWAECIRQKPSNRDKLMGMSVKQFIDQMEHWKTYFLAGRDLPVIGATEADLKSIKVPTIVMPGNDKTHGFTTGRKAHALIPGAELHMLFDKELDEPLGPHEVWDEKSDEMARVFADFLKRKVRAAATA